jgi:hypothetical protein
LQGLEKMESHENKGQGLERMESHENKGQCAVKMESRENKRHPQYPLNISPGENPSRSQRDILRRIIARCRNFQDYRRVGINPGVEKVLKGTFDFLKEQENELARYNETPIPVPQSGFLARVWGSRPEPSISMVLSQLKNLPEPADATGLQAALDELSKTAQAVMSK